MSRGFDPVFAFPTLSHNLLTAPSGPPPPLRAGVPPLARAVIRPPKRLPFPPCLPTDSTVRDFRRLPAPEDAKCIKITHGGVEIGALEKCDILAGWHPASGVSPDARRWTPDENSLRALRALRVGDSPSLASLGSPLKEGAGSAGTGLCALCVLCV